MIQAKLIVRDTFFLQQKSLPALPSDRFIGLELLATLKANQSHCVGLAANMIGYLKRIIAIDLGETQLLMYNPLVLKSSRPYTTAESCLSLEGSRPTQRFEEITVRFIDHDWRTQTVTLTGFAAQICQHELDHLEGRLI